MLKPQHQSTAEYKYRITEKNVDTQGVVRGKADILLVIKTHHLNATQLREIEDKKKFRKEMTSCWAVMDCPDCKLYHD